jgi:hypothetical protein
MSTRPTTQTFGRLLLAGLRRAALTIGGGLAFLCLFLTVPIWIWGDVAYIFGSTAIFFFRKARLFYRSLRFKRRWPSKQERLWVVDPLDGLHQRWPEKMRIALIGVACTPLIVVSAPIWIPVFLLTIFYEIATETLESARERLATWRTT